MGRDETTASVLSGHSERLAMAWSFLENPGATAIEVTQNLSVCDDCRK